MAGAVEEHVEGVLEWGSAEIDGIGAIQEGLSESAIKLEFCPFDWEPPVTRELADMPKGGCSSRG